MLDTEIPKEYSQRINTVINFILKNLKEELTLTKLASIANYSPFHFQKIFKQVVGISPKQYVISMRLENASHSLIIHKNKSITEIALDSGFASPATFARAFKNYFSVSAEELRALSPKDKIPIRQLVDLKKYKTKADTYYANNQYDVKYWTKYLKVNVTKISSLRTIFINVPLSDTLKIQEGFKKIVQLADTHDILTSDAKFIGIINPHQGLYRTAVTINIQQKLSKNFSTMDIDAGKFATYKILGDTLQTFHSTHAFFELWLPQSGYQIMNSNGFEILSQDPTKIPYHEIEREIYISIEPI